jgi:FAD/FMN-containing dehydrogenase
VRRVVASRPVSVRLVAPVVAPARLAIVPTRSVAELLPTSFTEMTLDDVFKRFSEVDPARAHAKLTHARLESLPIPAIDFADENQRKLHDEVAKLALLLLDGEAALGGAEDRAIELKLRELWGLTAEDGAYINGEFALLPPGQSIAELFPDGVPGAAIYDEAA